MQEDIRIFAILERLFKETYAPDPLIETCNTQPVTAKARSEPDLALALQFVWTDYFTSLFYDETQFDPCAILMVASDYLECRIHELAGRADLEYHSVCSNFDYHYESAESEQIVLKITIVFESVSDRISFEQIISTT